MRYKQIYLRKNLSFVQWGKSDNTLPSVIVDCKKNLPENQMIKVRLLNPVSSLGLIVPFKQCIWEKDHFEKFVGSYIYLLTVHFIFISFIYFT